MKEIYSYWTSVSPKFPNDCKYCNAEMIVCPKKGHPISKYWKYKSLKDDCLYVCPNNCLEDGKKPKKKRQLII